MSERIRMTWRTPWEWFRCKIGKPACHREWRKGINYAICNWCRRQSEVHQLGGPPPLAPWCLVPGCPNPVDPNEPFCSEHSWDDFHDAKENA